MWKPFHKTDVRNVHFLDVHSFWRATEVVQHDGLSLLMGIARRAGIVLLVINSCIFLVRTTLCPVLT